MDAERLVDQLREAVDEVQRGARADDLLVMLGAERGGHCPRVRRLVERGILEADGERLDPSRRVAARDGGHGRRIDAAREEHAERDVGEEMLAHRKVQRRRELRHRGDFLGRPAAVPDVPPRLELRLARRVHEPVPGRQLAHGAQDRLRRRHPLVGEIRGQRVGIELARDRRVDEHRLQLGGEDDLIGEQRVVERLDAQPVARQHQRLRWGVPHREPEHPLQVLEGVPPPHLPRVDDHLGVRAAAEHVALRAQPARELAIVVDLAVEDHPRRLILARHRLAAGVEVDDLEPPDAEPGRAAHDEAGVVRTAVGEPIGHRFEDRLVGTAVAARQDVADDAAHGRYSTPCKPSVSRT
jgi:hypothetical protein